jgi:hypothetical protein
MSLTDETLSHWRGDEVDSSAVGADGSALAQLLGIATFPAPMDADRRTANCPPLYTTVFTPSEKESDNRRNREWH